MLRTVYKIPNLNRRFVQFIVIAALFSGLGWLYLSSYGAPEHLHLPHLGSQKDTGSTSDSNKDASHPPGLENDAHPIDTLIRTAETELNILLAKETREISAAASAYRTRRGRHPPPGFDAWFAFAHKNDALIVEDFFDQIYHDLNPFWGLEAAVIRRHAKGFEHVISVRKGNVTWRSDHDRVWMQLWSDMVKGIGEERLPDVDLAINVMDESRLVVTWDEIDGYMKAENASRGFTPTSEVISKCTGLAALDAEEHAGMFDPEWIPHGPYWALAREGCAPDSPARKMPVTTDFSGAPPLPTEYPEHSYRGYVRNWTLAKSPCDLPNLQGLHGSFVEPISISTSKQLFPLFGGSKLPMNNEILLPAAMYWTSDPFYSGGESAHGGPWAQKRDKLIWRGAASGGRNRRENWIRFQRHRFVSMMNGTSVKLAETSNRPPPNFELPGYSYYGLAAPRNGYLGDWVATFADAAFVHLLCFPDEGEAGKCAYDEQYFSLAAETPMQEQYNSKYLPDIDGNSFSGRYRGFLRSTSLPIKATVYSEWHDARLVAWKHFVPMDNTFVDVYGLMQYFLGFGGKGAHDEVAARIAKEGREWAERVLRREDMLVYVYRLLLEYARICDDERHRLGWVGDLV
ncbi:hypothetical protein LTR16_000789 [Cryomyces antarcticus]|uniref:Glycosyl transferase CAP10 domain-containing protein n=1 Tax=Cryomyces antarcticus TaxID=329879 RepID=A0ABR0LQQ0_9PEZI|nr:hypothetical protein LTR16_000789 [Cryomyces antarcticus]